MTTQVIFKIDPVLKKKAQMKAGELGATYSDFLKTATKWFVEGEIEYAPPRIIQEFTPTKRDLVELKKAREDFKKGNYSTLEEVKRELGL